MLLIRLSHGYPEVTHSSLYCLLAFSTFGRQAGGVTAIAPRVQGRTSEVHKGCPGSHSRAPSQPRRQAASKQMEQSKVHRELSAPTASPPLSPRVPGVWLRRGGACRSVSENPSPNPLLPSFPWRAQVSSATVCVSVHAPQASCWHGCEEQGWLRPQGATATLYYRSSACLPATKPRRQHSSGLSERSGAPVPAPQFPAY